MPAIIGSFSGSVTVQTVIAVPDQSSHELNVTEIGGTQKSSDEKWDNATITYWGIADLAGGEGSQRGYFQNVHGDGDRDWGTFEGKVTTSGGEVIVEGTWEFTGGSGKFKGLTGGGSFKTKLSSPREVEASWQGTYALASATAQAH